MASITKLFRRKELASNAQPFAGHDAAQGPASATSEYFKHMVLLISVCILSFEFRR